MAKAGSNMGSLNKKYKMTQEQAKAEAKAIVDEMRGCSILLMQNSKGSIINPFKSGYVANYYTDVVFVECALKKVQSNIDLLEFVMEKTLNQPEFFINMKLHNLKQVKQAIEKL